MVVLVALVAVVAAGCRLEADDDGIETNLVTKQDMKLEIQVKTLVAGDYFVQPSLSGDEHRTRINGTEFAIVGCPADATSCKTTEGGTLKLQTCGTDAAAVCSLVYQPKKGFRGADTFRYHICHPNPEVLTVRTYCGEATVTIGVGDLVLEAKADAGYGTVSRDDVLLNDRLTVEGHSTNIPIRVKSFSVDESSELGGKATYDPKTRIIKYTPPAQKPGSAARNLKDHVTYRVCHEGTAWETSACGVGSVRFDTYQAAGPTTTTRPRVTTTTTTTSSSTTSTTADPDRDDDGVDNDVDNCPDTSNPGQDDNYDAGGFSFTGDGVGDACDDTDGDTVFDAEDNCPEDTNAGQDDIDEDGSGDACDSLRGDGAWMVTANAGDSYTQPFPLEIHSYGPDLVDFEVTNNDTTQHNFFIDLDGSFSVNGSETVHQVPPGETVTFTETIEPGVYFYRCDDTDPDHLDDNGDPVTHAGLMQGQIEVVAP